LPGPLGKIFRLREIFAGLFAPIGKSRRGDFFRSPQIRCLSESKSAAA
jgi:hypothetical protein